MLYNRCLVSSLFFFFFFNDTATTEIYTLSLHDALPISEGRAGPHPGTRAHPLEHLPRAELHAGRRQRQPREPHDGRRHGPRSEEHTSELQSRLHLVCRLLLEKKKIKEKNRHI